MINDVITRTRNKQQNKPPERRKPRRKCRRRSSEENIKRNPAGYDILERISFVQDSQWRTQEFCLGGGSTNSVEDRRQKERGSGGRSPLVRGFGGSCNLVQEISFHIVTFS